MPNLPVEPLEVGLAEQVQDGEDVLLLAVGRMVEPAIKAAGMLEQHGISCGVVNARWVKPLDRRIPEWAAGYPRVVTLEDNAVAGGFGSAVLEALTPHGLAGKVTLLGLPDRFLPAGSASEVQHEVGLDAESIAGRVAEALTGS